MRKFVLLMILGLSLAPLGAEEKCVQMRGRAVLWRGDSYFSIWHVGTHHEFFITDDSSQDLVCKYFDCKNGNRQPALFADFTLCPTEPFKQGAAQATTVKAVAHPRVVAMWPPPESPKEFVDEFYKWYGERVDPNMPDEGTLATMRWNLSPELSRLLTADRKAQDQCTQNADVGYGFDLIAGSQTAAESYEAAEIVRIGARFRASIYGKTQGIRSNKPDVVAEFVHDGDSWFFLNFFYPATKTDLLTMLKQPHPACTVPAAH